MNSIIDRTFTNNNNNKLRAPRGAVDCKYGQNCTNKSCTYKHPKVTAASGKLRADPNKALLDAVSKLTAAVNKPQPRRVRADDSIESLPSAVVPGTSRRTVDVKVIPILATLIDPVTHKNIGIPDGICVSHQNKQVVSSTSFEVDSGTVQGVLILFPDECTDMIAYRYESSGSGWDFKGAISMSSDLAKYYDYFRKVSGISIIKSTTIPAGAFSIAGTFAAATFVGTPTEVDVIGYDGIPAIQANGGSVVVDVPTLDGVVVLSGPTDFGFDYVRSYDTSPSAPSYGMTSFGVNIAKANEDLTYAIRGNCGNISGSSGAPYSSEGRFNIDCHTSLMIRGRVAVSTSMAVGTVFTITVSVVPITPFGEDVVNYVLGSASMPIAVYGNAISLPIDAEITSPQWHRDNGLIGAMKLIVTVSAPGNWSASAAMSFDATVRGAARGGARTTSFVAYNNVPPGSVISVSNVSNFECIPNPEIRATLETSYFQDGEEIPGALTLIANMYDDTLGLKPVYNAREYQVSLPELMRLAVMDPSHPSQRVYAASGFGKLLGGLKNLVMPFVKPILGAIPGGNMVSDVVDSLTAASGRLRASSTGILPLKGRAPRVPVSAQRSAVLHHDGKLLKFDSMAVFPALADNGAFAFIAAVSGAHQDLVVSTSFVSVGKHKVYGWADTTCKLPITRDVTFIPVRRHDNGWHLAKGPDVVERSCEGALYLVGVRCIAGSLYNPITGTVEGHTLQPLDSYSRKRDECLHWGLKLLGAGMDSEVVVRDLLHLDVEYAHKMSVPVDYRIDRVKAYESSAPYRAQSDPILAKVVPDRESAEFAIASQHQSPNNRHALQSYASKTGHFLSWSSSQRGPSHSPMFTATATFSYRQAPVMSIIGQPAQRKTDAEESAATKFMGEIRAYSGAMLAQHQQPEEVIHLDFTQSVDPVVLTEEEQFQGLMRSQKEISADIAELRRRLTIAEQLEAERLSKIKQAEFAKEEERNRARQAQELVDAARAAREKAAREAQAHAEARRQAESELRAQAIRQQEQREAQRLSAITEDESAAAYQPFRSTEAKAEVLRRGNLYGVNLTLLNAAQLTDLEELIRFERKRRVLRKQPL